MIEIFLFVVFADVKEERKSGIEVVNVVIVLKLHHERDEPTGSPRGPCGVVLIVIDGGVDKGGGLETIRLWRFVAFRVGHEIKEEAEKGEAEDCGNDPQLEGEKEPRYSSVPEDGGRNGDVEDHLEVKLDDLCEWTCLLEGSDVKQCVCNDLCHASQKDWERSVTRPVIRITLWVVCELVVCGLQCPCLFCLTLVAERS